MGAAVPLIIQGLGVLLPWAIRWAQSRFGPGGGAVGKQKLDAVLAIVSPAVKMLVSMGVLPQSVAADVELAVENALAMLKVNGEIPASNTPVTTTVTPVPAFPGLPAILPVPVLPQVDPSGRTFTFQIPDGSAPLVLMGGILFTRVSTAGQPA